MDRIFDKSFWIEADDAFYLDAERIAKTFWKKKSELGIFSDFESVDENEFPCGTNQGLYRLPHFTKEFILDDFVREARISISARGLYELRINGEKIGTCALAPEFTPYDKMIFYQTFFVEKYLRQGINLLEIIAADGWFAGHAQGIPGMNHLYGERPAVIADLECVLSTGNRKSVVTDDSFICSSSSEIYADLFMGERLDLTEKPVRYGVKICEYDKAVLEPQQGECIEVTSILNAVSVRKLPDGGQLVDYGQNIAGRPRLTLYNKRCKKEITIEHYEELLPNGMPYDIIPNFPYHDQKNTIVFDDRGELDYYPKFSFQGFRYIKVTGLDYELQPKDCRAEVIRTAFARSGAFACSNEKLNKLMSNIIWSQQGNMISIPTDCPQRERGGFTGDVEVFGRAAAWNYNVKEFFRRYLRICRIEQLPGGQIPIVAPYSLAYSLYEPNPGWTSAGWGDVIVFLPWDMYQAYGDIRFLEENFDAAEKWMAYVKRCAEETMPERHYMNFLTRARQKYLWNSGYHWGDWLIPGMDQDSCQEMSKEIMASLYYYRAVGYMINICKTLGKEKRAGYYENLLENIRYAFCQEYIIDGKLTKETQGNYVVAIATGIVRGETAALFAQRLKQMLEENDYRLQTGFLSTPFLLDVLWENGYHKAALKVLYQEECPSWMYEVNHGATTVWEEWDCITPDGTYKGSSFNHYAYGCVCDFIYRKVAGIQPLTPGVESVMICPEANAGLTWCRSTFDTARGTISVFWERRNKDLYFDIKVPENVKTRIKNPVSGKEINMNGGNYCGFV